MAKEQTGRISGSVHEEERNLYGYAHCIGRSGAVSAEISIQQQQPGEETDGLHGQRSGGSVVQAGMGDAGYRKIVQLLLTEEGILYTIIRGEKKNGRCVHDPVYAPLGKEKIRRCRSEE